MYRYRLYIQRERESRCYVQKSLSLFLPRSCNIERSVWQQRVFARARYYLLYDVQTGTARSASSSTNIRVGDVSSSYYIHEQSISSSFSLPLSFSFIRFVSCRQKKNKKKPSVMFLKKSAKKKEKSSPSLPYTLY